MSVRTGVDVGELGELPELQAVVDLFALIWRTAPGAPPVTSDLLRALSHSGNYVAGARIDDAIVGASVGFLAASGGRYVLHSHITGVRPEVQARGVGIALKQHQRAWALERGLAAVEWTFDPLVRRNAWFNVAKLGATVVGYEPNFYGSMADGVNAGEESDRCLVWWDIEAPAGRAEDEASLVRDGAAVALDDRDGSPVSLGVDTSAAVLLYRVPVDALALRRSDPRGASAWRAALRATFGEAVRAGFVADGMTPTGCYVVRRT